MTQFSYSLWSNMPITRKSLIDHIETYLGRIQRGWNQTGEGEKTEFQVIECAQGSLLQTRAFCTLGLSKHPLRSGVSTKIIRQELLILTTETFGQRNVPAVLQQLASAALEHRSAYLCGEIIERNNPIFPGKPFYAFSAVVPVLLPDEFATYINENGEETVFAWMVPITKSEADFVRKKGWSKFEDILIDRGADLVDLDRVAAV